MSTQASPSTSSAAVAGAACLSADTLLNLLECPVCLEVCVPPIYACSIGHKICKGCAPNIHRCPVCRSMYTGTRDFVAEDLYTKLSEAGLIPGANEEVDDDKEMPIECHLGTLSESLKTQCAMGSLTTLPTFECYVTHLVHHHKVSREELQMGAALRKRFYYRNLSFVRNGASKMLVLSCNGTSFLLMLNKSDDKIWVYVTVASNKIAKEFSVDLVIPLEALGDDGVLARNEKQHVHSIKELPENIYKSGACLVIKESTLVELGCHRLAKTGRYWEMKITIKHKSPETEKKPQQPFGPATTVRASPLRAPARAEPPPLPFEQDDADVDDLGDQILGLQSQVRDFRIGLMNRIQSAGRMEAGRTAVTAGGNAGRGISQLSPEEAPAGDGSIRNRTLLYRSPATSNLSADSSESETRNSLALRERSLGRLREHRDMVMELRRLREQREALDRLDRREREGRTFPRVERRALRRTQPSIITSRDFFTDSDDENEYIERLAREASHENAEPDSTSDGPPPFRPLRNPRRAASATSPTRTEPTLFEPDPARLRYFLAQQRRATSPDTATAASRFRDSSASSDSTCVIS